MKSRPATAASSVNQSLGPVSELFLFRLFRPSAQPDINTSATSAAVNLIMTWGTEGYKRRSILRALVRVPAPNGLHVMRKRFALLAIGVTAVGLAFVDASQRVDERVATGAVKYTLDVGGLP